MPQLKFLINVILTENIWCMYSEATKRLSEVKDSKLGGGESEDGRLNTDSLVCRCYIYFTITFKNTNFSINEKAFIFILQLYTFIVPI